ncbi:MAG: adenosylcobinamide-phosphate synthase CbiB [Pseudomonadota bacterium]
MILSVALILDAIFGEPKWLWSRLPHPAVLMGRLIAKADQRFNTGQSRRLKGVTVLITLLLATFFLAKILMLLGPILETLAVAILIAQRSLSDHVWAVAKALRLGLEPGRQAVAQIVGRDTQSLDQSGITRAAIESAAENLSDGVIAPVFWYLILGLPGLMLYKITNTADSMIGYRTPRHAEFGWAAARFDDLLNWIPARLTAALILLAHGRWVNWTDLASDAAKHRSPNAGWPEAAMAHVLNLALAGPRSYEGQLQSFPFVNDQGRKFGSAKDIEDATFALWRTWGVMLLLIAVAAFLF